MTIKTYQTSELISIYIPSTDEYILGPEDEEIDYDSEALIAGWLSERIHEPVIKDKELSAAWKKSVGKSFQKEPLSEDFVTDFLQSYDNPEWIVLKTTFEPSLPGYDPFTSWYVVTSDAVIEKG